MKYFVYALLDPRTEQFDKCGLKLPHVPFYIGKGHDNRPKQHLKSDKTNKFKVAKIAEIRQYNQEPIIYYLFENLEESVSYCREAEIITIIGLDNLTNITPGGKGVSRETVLGEKNPMYGKKRPRWIIEKAVKASIPYTIERCKNKSFEEIYGLSKAAELKKQMSKQRTGRTLIDRVGEERADEIKLEMSKKRKNKILSEEHRRKIREKASLEANIFARNEAVKKVREEKFIQIFEANRETILDLSTKGFDRNEIFKRLEVSRYLAYKMFELLSI